MRRYTRQERVVTQEERGNYYSRCQLRDRGWTRHLIRTLGESVDYEMYDCLFPLAVGTLLTDLWHYDLVHLIESTDDWQAYRLVVDIVALTDYGEDLPAKREARLQAAISNAA